MISATNAGDGTLTIETVSSELAAWITVHGEADIANVDQLKAALASVELAGRESVHIHVYDLQFADVASVRELAIFAIRAKQSGVTITICGAQPRLHRLARLMQVDGELGLT